MRTTPTIVSILILAIGGPLARADQPANADFEIVVELDRKHWTETESVQGIIKFEANTDSLSGVGNDGLVQHSPRLTVEIEPKPPIRELWQLDLDRALEQPLHVGERYKHRFGIALGEEFAVSRLNAGAKRLGILPPGRYRIRASLGSRPGWSISESSRPFISVVSDWVDFRIQHVPGSTFERDELARVLESVEPRLQGLLAEYYAEREYTLRSLSVFLPAPAVVDLAKHIDSPFLYEIEMGSRLAIRSTSESLLIVRSGMESLAMPTGKLHELGFPDGSGVYRVSGRHAIFGWVLVRNLPTAGDGDHP